VSSRIPAVGLGPQPVKANSSARGIWQAKCASRLPEGVNARSVL